MGKNYRFLVNFAPTDSLDISTYYDKVCIDLLMANIRKAYFSASLMVNAPWCVLVQQYVLWVGICYVNRKEISKIVFKPNFFEIGLFGLLHSKWTNYSDSAQLLSRQIHKTSNGLNPSSHFRARLSAKSRPNMCQIWQVFGPWTSPYGENGPAQPGHDDNTPPARRAAGWKCKSHCWTKRSGRSYHQVSNISRTWVGNKIVDDFY